MAEVASAYVTLIPRFSNLTGTISKALGGAYSGVEASSASAGKKASKAFGSSFIAGGALGLAASAASKAIDTVGNSLGKAVSRVDTMNNFPRVMASLGYSAEGAQASIDRMASRIDGLPTSLDGLASMTQRLTATTGDLDYATTLSIALNDALLAGGASTVDVERALVQYTQALAKGKPEMEDWRTLQEVMPGQLNAVAKAMMGAEATSNDLYEAMKDGTFSMDDFNEALIRLDNEGMEGMASFEEQARNATKGIGTALTNVGTRAAKAVAQVIEAIGSEEIAGAIDAFSSRFASIGSVAADAVGVAKRALGSLWEGVKESGAADTLKASLSGLREALVGLMPDVGGYIETWASSEQAHKLASQAVGLLSSGVEKLTAVVKKFSAIVNYAKGYLTYFHDELERNGGLEKLKDLVDHAGNALKNLWTTLKGAGDAFGSLSIKPAISSAVRTLASVVGTLATNAYNAVSHVNLFINCVRGTGVLGDFAASVRGLLDTVADLIAPLQSSAEGLGVWKGNADSTKAAAASFSSGIGKLASAFDKVSDGIKWAAEYLGTFFKTVKESGAVSALSDSMVALSTGLKVAWSNIKSLTSGMGAWKSAAESGKKAGDVVASSIGALSDALSRAGTFIASASARLRLFVETVRQSGAVSQLASSVKGFAQTLKDLVSSLLSGSDGLSAWEVSAGGVRKAASLVSSGIEGLAGLFDKAASAAAWAADHMGQVKPVLAGVAGAIAGVVAFKGPISGLVGVVKGVGPAISGVSAALKLITGGPVGLVVGAISGLAAAFTYLYTTNDTFRSGVQDAWGFIQSKAAEVFPAVQGAVEAAMPVVQSTIEAAMPVVQGLFSAALSVVQSLAETVFPALQAAVDSAIPVVQSAIETALPVVQGLFEAAVPVIQSVAETVFPALQAAVEAAIPVVQGLIEGALPVVQGLFETATAAIQVLSDTVLPVIQSTVETVMPAVQGAVEAAMPVVQSLFEGAIPVIQTLVEEAWPVIQSAIETAMAAVQGAVQLVVPLIQALFEFAMPAIQNIIETVWPAIQSTIVTVMGIVQSVVSFAMDFIQAVITVVTGIIEGDWSKVWGAISTFLSDTWDNIKKTVSDVLDKVWECISGKVGEIKQSWSDSWDNVKKTLSDAWEEIKLAVSDGISGVVGFVTELPGKIVEALGNVGSLLFDAGSSIISGFLDGLKSMWDEVTGWFSGIGEWIVEHKGPPSYDAVMLVKNGQLIMQGLNRGLADGWGETRALLDGYTEDMARAGSAMGLAASFEASGPVARSYRVAPAGGPASTSVVIQNMNINARDLRDVKTVEQFSARVLGRELAVL